jgi:hypothetical protein
MVVSGDGWFVMVGCGGSGGCRQWQWRRRYTKENVTSLDVNISCGEVLLSSGHTTNNLGNSA